MSPTSRTVTHGFQYGEHELVLETGGLARQTNAAVLARLADTVVLATVVARAQPSPDKHFLPLTVNFQEKFYAGGRIPGGFFKREGRPSERETLAARLIDRPIRPLFPDEFRHETQVVVTVLSSDPQVDAEIPAMVAASAALRLSGVPFSGPIGAARVGMIDGQYILNPTASQLADSALDLVVAGTARAVLMVESEARLLTEAQMLGAVEFGHRQMQAAILAIEELAAMAGVARFEWSAPERDRTLGSRVVETVGTRVARAFTETDRTRRRQMLEQLRAELLLQLETEAVTSGWSAADIDREFSELEYRVLRDHVLYAGRRVDGRALDEIRPISTRVGVLPRAHGSALFVRGETQALVTVTLGTKRDSQIIDAMEGESRDPFLFHYNFPPFCVGETGMMTGPKRREIGHGRLARRGVQAVMPDSGEFAHVVRVVSEILESNGSSSMASVCGSSMALMDAGVPLKWPVAGVAMGLVKEGDKYAVLTDILGDEDHLGDMDFKVAGTSEGISALQMDIKIDGITADIMQVALERARVARLHILGEMARTIERPAAELSVWAPRLYTMRVPTERIRDVIGKGGSTIRALSDETGAQIDIADDGTVTIAATNGKAAQEAMDRIRLITSDVEPGAIYDGRVVKILDFGAFVSILPGRDGLVHVSQVAIDRVERVADHLSEGDAVRVKVLEVDRQGRIRLSIKAVLEAEAAAGQATAQ